MRASIGKWGELDEALRAVDPRARLVSSRVLRRIIKQEQKLGLLGLHRAHRRSLTIGASAALRAVSREDLGIPAGVTPSGLLLLIGEPDDVIAAKGRPALRLWAWRRLFHASVHAELDEKIASGRLDASDVDDRIARIGRREFAEIRGVLDQDGWLLSPRDEVATYAEFLAVYLELKSFAEALLPVDFPGIEDYDRIDRVVAEDLDGAALLLRTRPDGAPEPGPMRSSDDARPVPAEPLSTEESVLKSEPRFRRLIAAADRARALGNLVRSAMLRTRATRLAGPSRAGQARAGAEDDLDRLAARLQAALGSPPAERTHWRPALSALLDRSMRAFWTVEARLLFDLQSVCVDFEREIYEVDLLGWIASLGRRPLKRALPNQKLVRVTRHLRTANARLPRLRIADADRAALARFLREAAETSELALRERLQPLISRALERADLGPRDLPERVSFGRMTEELLDLIVQNNHLTMGDVRDAVSRSDIRLPDLREPRQTSRGDRILKANRRFAVSLDGVYRPGEIYLRLLQRMSLVAFGTRVGRWLTRYVALPFGGAFGTLVVIEELTNLTFHKLLHLEHSEINLKHASYVLVLGTIFLLLLHSPRFRATAGSLGLSLGRVLKRAFHDVPAWVLSRPAIRSMLMSSAFDLARRVVIQPLICAGLAYGVVLLVDHDRAAATGIAIAIYATLALFLGTRIGRETEEVVADATARGWRRLQADFLPGLIRLILDVFDAFLEAVERVLYAVDEKLRYRSGQGRATFWAKAVLGMVWGIVTYLIRIFINLLVEPTVNPVKHFPTVTVAAKMIIPAWNQIAHGIAHAVGFLGAIPSQAIGYTMVIFLPGLAGFFVWELKENWRLFAANRPRTIRPVIVGHHGETMRRLLVPGLHSGTIPKLFAKLRKASRRAYWTGDSRPVHKAREQLHHVEEPIRHFVERGLIAFLVESGRFAPGEVKLSDLVLATNRVGVVLASRAEGMLLTLSLVDEDSTLIGSLDAAGWERELTAERRRILDAALAGCLASAGVDAREGARRPSTGGTETHLDGEACVPAWVPTGDGVQIDWREWVAFWRAVEDSTRHEPAPSREESAVPREG